MILNNYLIVCIIYAICGKACCQEDLHQNKAQGSYESGVDSFPEERFKAITTKYPKPNEKYYINNGFSNPSPSFVIPYPTLFPNYPYYQPLSEFIYQTPLYIFRNSDKYPSSSKNLKDN